MHCRCWTYWCWIHKMLSKQIYQTNNYIIIFLLNSVLSAFWILCNYRRERTVPVKPTVCWCWRFSRANGWCVLLISFGNIYLHFNSGVKKILLLELDSLRFFLFSLIYFAITIIFAFKSWRIHQQQQNIVSQKLPQEKITTNW